MSLSSEPTNADRSDWAREVLEVFKVNHGLHHEDWQTVISDFLCDLQHFCDRNEVEYNEALRIANSHYEQEVEEAQIDAQIGGANALT